MVILTPTVLALGFQYFAGTLKTVQITKPVSMDNVDCFVVMTTSALLEKNASTRNVCCLALRIQAVPREKLASLVVIAK